MVEIELLIEGGKATSTPQIAQSLGPLKINIANVLSEINEKTSSFKGIKVPVKIRVNEKDKTFTVEIGTPSTAELIKKEIGVEKGSAIPNKDKIGNLAIEQLIKIAKIKKDNMFVNDLKSAVKTVAGTCNSMGVLIEGKEASKIIQRINQGHFDKEINNESTEIPKDKKIKLKMQLEAVQKEFQKEKEKLAALEEKPKEEAVEEEAKEEKPKVKEEKEKKTKEEKEKIKEGK